MISSRARDFTSFCDVECPLGCFASRIDNLTPWQTNKRKIIQKRNKNLKKFRKMLCIFSIILEISNAETFTQTVNITKYGEKIEMKKYAACHFYDYENETSTIIVKIGEDHEFLDINDIQIGINHIYLPPEVREWLQDTCAKGQLRKRTLVEQDICATRLWPF